MGRIHAITVSGEVIKDISVFQEAYRLVGLGWVYGITTLTVLGDIGDRIYGVWDRWRLPLTGRRYLDQLCKIKNLSETKLAE